MMISRLAHRLLQLGCLCALTLARASAQDVTVSPFAWADPRVATGELPGGNFKKLPEFPAELKGTPDYGYAIVVLAIDKKGDSSLTQIYASLHPFAEVAATSLDQAPRFRPARLGGRPSAARVKYTVAFNPASASPTLPDAAPRLLAADTVVDPDPPESAHPGDNPIEIIWVRLALDSAGRAIEVKEAPERLVAPLTEQLASFRFAPARRGGQAVDAEIRFPIIALMGMTKPGDTQPVLIKSVDPVYPEAMLESALNGEVIVDFVVGVSGNVTHAVVHRSFNPAFNQAALDAILNYKFTPGRRGGQVAPVRFRQSLLFQVIGAARKQISGFVVQRIADPATPDGNDAEVSPAVRGTVLPVYPYALLRAGVSGRAAVTALVDADGRMIEPKVVFADRPEFGAALLAAFACFSLDPALKHGRPVTARVAMVYIFSRNPTDGALAKEDGALLALEKKDPDEIVAATGLDTPPKLLVSRLVTHADETGTKGKVDVEVLIDTDGAVRLPRVVSTTDSALGWTALQAISAARFTPPRHQGRPVVARLRFPVTFPQSDQSTDGP